MTYILENVTDSPDLWFNRDPVRPELDIEFRIEAGREVFGLKDEHGKFKAFLCMARTTDIPTSTKELDLLTSITGRIAVPYSVWSYQKGAGKEIINQVLTLMQRAKTVSRVITLSPLTEMARKFHLRNDAIELQKNDTTVNFEYHVI
tara:strand:+ start:65 stop:505 length:441 start_codon:yes stop_codon:yes gene_type:complete